MRLAAVLSGAAAAAVLLTGAAVVRVVTDPEIRDCAGALAAAEDATAAQQYALKVLDRETYFRRVTNEQAKQRARTEVDQATQELDAAEAEVARLCHYQR